MRKMDSFVLIFLVLSVASAERVCYPGELVKKDCNTCVCSQNGDVAACTDMACPLATVDVASVNNSSQQVCEPNAKFKDYCNTCACANDGSAYICTKQMCDEKIWNKDGTLKLVRQASKKIATLASPFCEANKSFKRDCNTCFCNDGFVVFCTLMQCEENLNNEDENANSEIARKKRDADVPVNGEGQSTTPAASNVNKICQPGVLTKVDGICNVCICNEDGTKQACTKYFCSSTLIKTLEEEEYAYRYISANKQIDSCKPYTMFFNECNKCVCKYDGKTSYCTNINCHVT